MILMVHSQVFCMQNQIHRMRVESSRARILMAATDQKLPPLTFITLVKLETASISSQISRRFMNSMILPNCSYPSSLDKMRPEADAEPEGFLPACSKQYLRRAFHSLPCVCSHCLKDIFLKTNSGIENISASQIGKC